MRYQKFSYSHSIFYSYFRMARSLGVLFFLLIIVGCARKGDFGRPQESIFVDILGEELNGLFYEDRYATGDIDGKGRYTGPKFSLTPHEIELRDIALHFHQPLTKENSRLFHSRLAQDYAEDLTRKHRTYGPARVKYILAHIKADQKWLARFRKVAPKVRFADQKREHALRVKNMMLTARDRIRTVSRIKENNQVIYKVFQDLQRRLTNYQYAIERSRLETPNANVNELDTALALLRERVVLAQAEYDKIIRELAEQKQLRLKKALEKARTKRAVRLKEKAQNDPNPLPWHKKPKSSDKGSRDMGDRIEGKSLAPLDEPPTDWAGQINEDKRWRAERDARESLK